MDRISPLRFQLVRSFALVCVLFLALGFCQNLWAAQDAIVTADLATVFADEQMSAPIGYVRKGKKIRVGDIPKNRAQVYAIIVSGKVAYIRVVDVSTEKESVDSTLLVAERFQKGTQEERPKNYSVAFYNFSSQINVSKQNAELQNKDPVNWVGVSFRGGAQLSPKWDMDVLINYMNAKEEDEVYRALEFGFGAALRVYDQSRFKVKFFAELLAIPFSTYSVGEDFRVNGFGFSTGGGLRMNYRFGKYWGLEALGGFYYTKLSGFDAPEPYSDISPSFLGTRLGLGLNYQF